ncbi:hypothetical protein AB0J38_14355 [Streptomyces sp. NPDC050095]|uniref:hypothetical protein n=1 Tax=unclassified Streptomyces TaxID=2593676 RepID=UPI003434797A
MTTPTAPPAAYAPLVQVQQPQAPPRRHGLYSAATVIDERVRQAYAQWTTDTCAQGDYWALCDPERPGNEDLNDHPKRTEQPRWDSAWPIGLYAGLACGDLRTEDIDRRVRVRLDAVEERLIERALWSDQAGILPTLKSERTVLLAEDAVDLQTAVGLLEEALGSATSELGVLHAPRRLAAPARAKNLANPDGPRLRSPLGAPWAFGAGYGRSGPDGTESNGTAWIYATGQVTVRRDAVQVLPGTSPRIAGFFDPPSNTHYAIAERVVLVTFDCPLFAVPVTDDTPALPALPAPARVSAVGLADKTSALITWAPVPGAEAYEVDIAPNTTAKKAK